MNILFAIEVHQICLRSAARQAAMPNNRYDKTLHYQLIDLASRWGYQVINHKDYTPQLQDEHYPNGIGDIAYPVSC